MKMSATCPGAFTVNSSLMTAAVSGGNSTSTAAGFSAEQLTVIEPIASPRIGTNERLRETA